MLKKYLYFPRSILTELSDVRTVEHGIEKFAVTYDQLRAKAHQAYWAEQEHKEGLAVLVVVAALVLDTVVMVQNEEGKLSCITRPIRYSDGFRGDIDEALEMSLYYTVVENIIQPDTRVYQFQGLFYLPEFPNLLLIPWAIRYGKWQGLKREQLQLQFNISKIPELLDRMEPMSARIMYDIYSSWLSQRK